MMQWLVGLLQQTALAPSHNSFHWSGGAKAALSWISGLCFENHRGCRNLSTASAGPWFSSRLSTELARIFFCNKNMSFLKSSTGELLHVLISRTMPYSQVNVDQIRFLVFFPKIAKIISTLLFSKWQWSGSGFSASAMMLSKRVPEKHLFLLYWLCQSLWLCGSQ